MSYGTTDPGHCHHMVTPRFNELNNNEKLFSCCIVTIMSFVMSLKDVSSFYGITYVYFDEIYIEWHINMFKILNILTRYMTPEIYIYIDIKY